MTLQKTSAELRQQTIRSTLRSTSRREVEDVREDEEREVFVYVRR